MLPDDFDKADENISMCLCSNSSDEIGDNCMVRLEERVASICSVMMITAKVSYVSRYHLQRSKADIGERVV